MMTQSTHQDASEIIEADITIEDQQWEEHSDNYSQAIKDCLQAAMATLIDHPVKELDNLFVSVVLSNDDNIQKLNKEYREKDKPTNVLSFPAMEFDLEENDDGVPNIIEMMPQVELGDIILAYETINREASEQNKSINDHFKHLIVHGFLHLLGYDHIEDNEAEQMESLEVKILSKLGVKNPYI